MAVTVTLPFAVTLLARAVVTLGSGASVTKVGDAAAILAVTGGVVTLWTRAWWRRHGHQIHRLLARPHSRGEGR
ncbi:hypothetical protein [Rhizomonospora bruguierae]|uniref:hypothetical protein n=1 Tax=Rhizomonospora bruguierae TaxID=1581705 RepID=UPI001BCAF2BD|nr:hypothetical protein [Micromonospora sp. NBRC 107566]